MDILKILLVLLILSIIPGQILRLPFFLDYGAVNLTDLIVILTDLFFIIYALSLKKSIILSRKVFPAFIIFFTWVLAVNIFSLTIFEPKQTLVSTFFLIRLVSYFFISQVILNIVKREEVANWLNLISLTGLIFIFLGLIQLIFFADLTSLTEYGWDPHQRRIVSTILDPNFAGLIFTIIFTTATSHLLFVKKRANYFQDKNQFYFFLISILSIISIVLTFSRSSYLALLGSVFVIGFIKSPKMFFLTIGFLLFSFLAIPQVKNRIIGALTLDDTAQARIISWNNALTIVSKQPIFGVGFNNYRYAQEKYQLYKYPEQVELHSSSGSDSSFLLVAATTGIIGLSLFIIFIFTIFGSVYSKASKVPIKLISFSVLIALLVHSQFVNSLFFPQISVLFWFIYGLSQANDY